MAKPFHNAVADGCVPVYAEVEASLAISSKAAKKAKSVAPACVSKVSSGNIDSNMMVRNTIYKIDYVESSI